MNTYLVIDWGNTRIKAAAFVEDKIVAEVAIDYTEKLEKIIDFITDYQPKACILCAVSTVPDAFIDALKSNLQLIILDANTSLPIINAYSTTASLGTDRIALAVAAHAQYPNQHNLVIALGTAITYNFIHQNKIFRGGGISPGMQMRFNALHQFTARLPEVSADGEVILLGYDTDTCIRSGVILGMAAELDGIINQYATQYPELNVVLTGGDLSVFANKLKSKIFADAHFLFKGLYQILRHNVG